MVTVDDLRDLKYLPKEIEQIKTALSRLNRANTFYAPPPQIKRYNAAITELNELYNYRLEYCNSQLDKMNGFLNGIDDNFTRDLFRTHYQEGKEWSQIKNICADKGIFYDESSLRQICRRYTKRYNENEAEEKEKMQGVL